MDPRLRTGATITVLCGVLVVFAIWGWSSLTAAIPGTGIGSTAEAAKCNMVTVKKGEKVYSDQVVVSVFNAGTTSGLAGKTMKQFVQREFGLGDDGNAPPEAEVLRAQIWANDVSNPAVRLVRAQLGQKTQVIKGDDLGPGVVVLVGDDFTRLRPAQKFATANKDAEICSPPTLP